MTVRDHDQQMEIEMRRQQIIERAVETADRIILDGSDGSVEETNFLTSEVALKFAAKAANPFRAAMLRKDIGV